MLKHFLFSSMVQLDEAPTLTNNGARRRMCVRIRMLESPTGRDVESTLVGCDVAGLVANKDNRINRRIYGA